MTTPTITITLPEGRGKLARGARPWARQITAAAPNATSGHGYEGDWLTYGAAVEVEGGDIVAIQDADLDGAAIYVLDPARAGRAADCTATSPLDFEPGTRPAWTMIAHGDGRTWAGQCAAAVREWLNLSRAERVQRLRSERLVAITQLTPKRARSKGGVTYYDADVWAVWYARLREYAESIAATTLSETKAGPPEITASQESALADLRRLLPHTTPESARAQARLARAAGQTYIAAVYDAVAALAPLAGEEVPHA